MSKKENCPSKIHQMCVYEVELLQSRIGFCFSYSNNHPGPVFDSKTSQVNKTFRVNRTFYNKTPKNVVYDLSFLNTGLVTYI